MKQGIYNTGGGVARMAIQVVTVPLLIRLMGADGYGLWVLASSVLALIVLLEGGLSIATTVFLSREIGSGDKNGASSTLLITGCAICGMAAIAALLLMLGAAEFSARFPGLSDPERDLAAVAVWWSGIAVALRLFQQFLVGIEQAFQRYGPMNAITTTNAILTNVVLLLVVWKQGTVVGMMKAQCVLGGLMLLVHCGYSWRLLRGKLGRWRFERSRVGEIFHYCLMSWGVSLGSRLFTLFDRFVVGGLLGTAALGVYGAIAGIAAQINALSAMPAQPLVPNISSTREADGLLALPARVMTQLKESVHLSSLVAFGAGLSLFLLAPQVIQLMIPGAEGGQYVGPFSIAIIIFSLYSINAPAYYVLHGLREMRICLLVQLVSGICALSLITLGAVSHGLTGAILGSAGYLCVFGLTWFAAGRLKIPIGQWLLWSAKYFACFAIFVFIGSVVGDGVLTRGLLTVIGGAALCGMFVADIGGTARLSRYLDGIRNGLKA